MDKTPFAGLTRLDAQDSFSLDGFAFQSVDPLIVDRLLKVGAKSHRHDAHNGLVDPIDQPTAELTASGLLPADTSITFSYTLVDADGGETKLAPVLGITTDPPMESPADLPDYTIVNDSGQLLPGFYTYAITLTDPTGETTIGPTLEIEIEPGADTNSIQFVGLSDIVAATPGATGWRMYKATGSGHLTFLAAGGAALDELLEDGTLCADCTTEPPTTNQTRVSQGVTLTIPGSVNNQQPGVAGIRIYAGIDGDFTSPSFVEQRPPTDLSVPIDYSELVVNPGAPPDTNTSVGGAAKIDPDRELIDWHWKRPVSTWTELPEPADEGDVRIVIDTGYLWVFRFGGWNPVAVVAEVAFWLPPVADVAALPPTGNTDGDVRLALTENTLHRWDATAVAWIEISGGGGGNGGGNGGGAPANNLFVGDGVWWSRHALGEDIVASLQLNGTEEQVNLKDDEFDVAGSPPPDWTSDSMKAAGGFMVPDDASSLNADHYSLLTMGPSHVLYSAELRATALNANWDIVTLWLGPAVDDLAGIELGFDKAASTQKPVLRWRASAANAWQPYDTSSSPNLALSSGKRIRLTLVRNIGDPTIYLDVWVGPDSDSAPPAGTFYSRQAIALPAEFTGLVLQAGVHAKFSARDSFQVSRFIAVEQVNHYEMVAGVLNPDGEWTYAPIITSA